MHRIRSGIVGIILALVFVNFTEYVVKPAQASFEAARAAIKAFA